MTITLRPAGILLIVGLIGTLLGLSLGQLTFAKSNSETASSLSVRASNAQVVGQLRALNNKVSYSNSKLTDMDARLDDIWSDQFDMVGFVESIKEDTNIMKSDLGSVKFHTDRIDESTFGTCLYVSDDGGKFCE